jgi:tetratricopeptide (TPR) repeat protein
MKRVIVFFVFLLSLVSQAQDNKKVISILMEIITNYEKSGDVQSKDYSTSLNNLAGLYLDQGNYSKAEPLYLQSITIDKKILGENHPDYATTLNNLALL